MNIGVNLKITAAVCAAVVVSVVVGIAGIFSLNEANAAAQNLYHNNLPSLLAVGEVDAALAQGQLDLANATISEDDATVDAYVQAFQDDQTEFSTATAAYRAADPAGDPAVVEDLETRWQSLVQVAEDRLIKLGRVNDQLGYQKVRDAEVTGIMKTAGDDVDKLRAAETADAATFATQADQSASASRLRAILMIILGALLALALGTYVARSIVRSLPGSRTSATAWPPATSPAPAVSPRPTSPVRWAGPWTWRWYGCARRSPPSTARPARWPAPAEQMSGTVASRSPRRPRDVGAGTDRVGGRRADLPQRRHGVGGQRADGRLDPRDLAERRRGRPGRRRGGRAGRAHLGHDEPARRLVRPRSAT